MKKKFVLLVLTVVMAINLSACDTGDTGLSESELNQVAEYAAKMVLKHTRNYKPTLQEELEIKENPNVVKEDFSKADEDTNVDNNEKNNSNTSSSIENNADINNDKNSSGDNSSTSAINETDENSDTAATLNDVYKSDGFEVVYGGAGEYSRYPKNEGYFSLVAADNMKLYVVEFSIRNKTDKKKKFSQNDGVTYNLTFDGSNYIKPSLTLLENDMQTIEVAIAGGKSSKGVIVFNVPKAADRNKAKLKVSNGNKSYTLNVAQ